MAKRKKSEKRIPRDRMKDEFNQICNCCVPTARLIIGTSSTPVFVMNSIDKKSRYQTRADANASVLAPGGPNTSSDGSGGVQVDEGLLMAQGKVYRTDKYTVHWWATGFGPLRVSIKLSGAIVNQIDWAPSEGTISFVKNQYLEPPKYAATNTTVVGSITVEDCKGQRVQHSHLVTI